MNRKGFVLIVVMAFVVILITSAAGFIKLSNNEIRATMHQGDSMKAFYIAEGGIDKAKQVLYNSFRDVFIASGWTTSSFTWFDNPNNYTGLLPTNEILGGGRYTVTVPSVTTPDAGKRDVEMLSTATVGNEIRKVRATVRYELSASGVFDYAYFINNFGWFYGGGITAHGHTRSNGNFAFSGNPTVNGDIYAAINTALAAAGTITGSSRNDTISQYRTQAPVQARPSNPTATSEDSNSNGLLDSGEDTNMNSQLDTYGYESGYDGTSSRYPSQQILDMPYLGDLQDYRNIAIDENGQISQGGVTLVNNVYSGAGYDNVTGTPDDGSIVLIGTVSNPVVISGPVVVNGDVLIKGTVQGQGTIYAGRNVHVLDNLTYANGPAWPKPDTNPAQTDTTNNSRDFLGLAAKGNVVIGNYTNRGWQSNCLTYLRPPFTQSYTTDATDAPLGYDSDNYSGNGYLFNGNYTVSDGGTKVGGASRKYYESSLADSTITSIGASVNVQNVNAVIYTNHVCTGKLGAFSVNGAIVSRDEAMVYSGSIKMNYDIRVRSRGDDFHLPRGLEPPRVITWSQGSELDECH